MTGFPVSRSAGVFSGMFVTGPRDGQFFTHNAERYTILTLPEMETFWQPGRAPNKDPAAERQEFKWVRGTRGETECDFWVPVDKDFSWALHVIFGAYADRGRRFPEGGVTFAYEGPPIGQQLMLTFSAWGTAESLMVKDPSGIEVGFKEGHSLKFYPAAM